MSKILEVKNLNVILGGVKVLDDLSFDVDERDILAIIGPNSAGKTVLFKTLLGLLPYTGEIKW
jgi:ABC-type Mn2+/Zn2+ transport system ATPase subunit